MEKYNFEFDSSALEPKEENIPKEENKPKTKKKTKRKKRKARIKFYAMNIILALVIILVGAGLFINFACTLEKVTCKGNSIYSDEEIEMLLLGDSSNTVISSLKSVVKPVRHVDFIDSYKIRITSIHSVQIVVKEKKPYAYYPITDGEFVYLDINGEVTDVSKTQLMDRVYFMGVYDDKVKEGKTPEFDDKDIIKIYQAVAKSLSENKISVNAISIDKKHNITLTYNTVTVSLGTKSLLQSKVKRLVFILPQLENRTGILHLENYSEENTDIVFKMQ